MTVVGCEIVGVWLVDLEVMVLELDFSFWGLLLFAAGWRDGGDIWWRG